MNRQIGWKTHEPFVNCSLLLANWLCFYFIARTLPYSRICWWFSRRWRCFHLIGLKCCMCASDRWNDVEYRKSAENEKKNIGKRAESYVIDSVSYTWCSNNNKKWTDGSQMVVQRRKKHALALAIKYYSMAADDFGQIWMHRLRAKFVSIRIEMRWQKIATNERKNQNVRLLMRLLKLNIYACNSHIYTVPSITFVWVQHEMIRLASEAKTVEKANDVE